MDQTDGGLQASNVMIDDRLVFRCLFTIPRFRSALSRLGVMLARNCSAWGAPDLAVWGAFFVGGQPGNNY
jgi:hypothetical protein